MDMEISKDEDMAGSLVFILLFATTLLMNGKIQFGYIYGFTFIGTFLIYIIMNLQLPTGPSYALVLSILGYSLLPLVPITIAMSLFFISWCAKSASNLFNSALEITKQKILIIVQCVILYSYFSLLIFAE
ncbi:hypothetical protein A3Q56_08344 [Intoshia linei]|uniref:Protein YIPF n=1 Tax=Intoshia linei TaxID=1819745 RepID=A0A177ARF7_9BILA|nr:hypothetical protein A3Q56_08344 [Intoshia linei]